MGLLFQKGHLKNNKQLSWEAELAALRLSLGIEPDPPSAEEIAEAAALEAKRAARREADKRRGLRDKADMALALAAADAAGLSDLSASYLNPSLCGSCTGSVPRIEWDRIPASLRPSFKRKKSARE